MSHSTTLTAPRPAATTAPSKGPAPTPLTPAQLERIRVRAFELYKARRGGAGDATSDWLAAEREVLAAMRSGR